MLLLYTLFTGFTTISNVSWLNNTMRQVLSLAVVLLVGCATKPLPLPPPCEYTVGGKCRTFTADDKQGATTYGHSNEIK